MADPPRRVNFFNGMMLTPADLAAEQEYHREMRYLHNRLHGYGTVSGLEVTVRKGHLLVSPGLAREWVTNETYVLTLPNWGVGSDHRPLVATFQAEDK